VALRILDVIERDALAENARQIGEFLLHGLRDLRRRNPNVVRDVRGLGLMIGIEFDSRFTGIETVKRLHEKNLLTIPAATSVVRLLPPLNLREEEARQGLRAIEEVIADLAEQEQREVRSKGVRRRNR
jgi:acetylornithine/succinyldiaminopimelate/putrescine aminotransferase